MKPDTMHIDGMYPVSAQSTPDGWTGPGLAFEDYTRMSTQQRKQSGERRLQTPEWAINNAQMQELLVCFQEERAGFRKRQKGTLPERLKKANAAIVADRPRRKALLVKLAKQYVSVKTHGAHPELTDEAIYDVLIERGQQPSMIPGHNRELVDCKTRRDLEIEIEGIDTYLRYTTTGGADVVAAIVYLYYRIGLDSVGVGAELGLKPPHVRQTLWRMFETAYKLWPDAGPKPVRKNCVEPETEVAPPMLGLL